MDSDYPFCIFKQEIIKKKIIKGLARVSVENRAIIAN
jgi:hypothetical protein